MEKILWSVVRIEKLLTLCCSKVWKIFSGVSSKNGKDTLECIVRMEKLFCRVERIDKLLCSVKRIKKLLCSRKDGKASLWYR